MSKEKLLYSIADKLERKLFKEEEFLIIKYLYFLWADSVLEGGMNGLIDKTLPHLLKGPKAFRNLIAHFEESIGEYKKTQTRETNKKMLILKDSVGQYRVIALLADGKYSHSDWHVQK